MSKRAGQGARETDAGTRRHAEQEIAHVVDVEKASIRLRFRWASANSAPPNIDAIAMASHSGRQSAKTQEPSF